MVLADFKENDIVHLLAVIIGNNFFYVPFILFLAYLIKGKDGLYFMIFSFLTTLIAKQIFSMPRICTDLLNCPKDFAFPSGHASSAFSLALLRIGKNDFPFFLLFALFVGYTRILLNVHTDFEILGSLAMALINIELWWFIWKKKQIMK